MPSLKERATAIADRARARWPLLDHGVRTQQHYSRVGGSNQAGAVTYFAFLSFFPILALAFFAIGYVAEVYPEARADLVRGLESILPGLVGDGDDQISLDAVEHAARAVGILGALGLLYSGLGWLSAMREALETVFEQPPAQQPSFVVGKLRDLATLVVIGVILLVSVALSTLATRFSADLLDLVGLSAGLQPVLTVVGILVAVAADMVLFVTLFALLAHPRLPARALWSGALVGAVGAELLKWLSSYLIAATKSQPAVQAFGIALILLVWINYFSRVVMYAAAWAHTHPEARAEESSGPVSSSEPVSRRP